MHATAHIYFSSNCMTALMHAVHKQCAQNCISSIYRSRAYSLLDAIFSAGRCKLMIHPEYGRYSFFFAFIYCEIFYIHPCVGRQCCAQNKINYCVNVLSGGGRVGAGKAIYMYTIYVFIFRKTCASFGSFISEKSVLRIELS